MVDLNDLDIEYRVSPRRRSIGIMVTTEGKVVVTLPRGASRESLARALEKHRAWIEAKVAERQAAWGQIKAGEAYFLGEAFRLTVLRGATGAVTLNGPEIRVPAADRGRSLAPVGRLVRRAGLYAASGPGGPFCRLYGSFPGPVELKGWKRRWGECHPDGTLSSTGASSCARQWSSTTWWCMNWRTLRSPGTTPASGAGWRRYCRTMPPAAAG